MSTQGQANELLVDAQLVIDFASRAGLLEQPNDPLIDEVRKVREQLAADPNGVADPNVAAKPHLGTLYVALSKAVKTISPYVSLRELKDGYSPFVKPKWRQTAGVWTLLILFSLSLFLSIMLIQRLQNNLTLISEINSVNQINLDNQIKIIVQRILDGSLKKPDSKGYIAYGEALDKEKKANAQAADINASVKAQDQGFIYNWIIKFFLPYVPNNMQGTNYPGGWLSGGTKKTATTAGVSNPSPGFNADPKNNVEQIPYDPKAYSQTWTAKIDDCADQQKALNRSSDFQAAKKGEEFTECISNSLGFLSTGDQQKLVDTAHRRTMEVYILVAWLLPLFVGMLGSSVYLIHNYYFETNRALGSSIRVVIRFILGGIAGVIIGWFYAPARYTGNGLELVDTIKQFPFMFAFLAGFSSEYAFSFMTKLISTTSNQPATKSNVVLDSPKP